MSNRISPYEAGWLTFLVEHGLASASQAREAQNRVAQDAVRELEERQRRRRAERRRKRREED
jgi:hypothetical protein